MSSPSGLEIALFLAIFPASVTVFLKRFVPILRTIRRSKNEPGFQLDPIGHRIRDFIWEVLLQGKVIRERPLPGLAHAFVFWGFCAFALVTLNHFASGFGFPFISREHWFGAIYFYIAAI